MEMATSQDMFLNESVSKSIEFNESDDDEEADANVRFIEAVIQLKSIINSRSTISANKFKDVLELFLSPEKLGQSKSIIVRDKKIWSNESISCCALGYVMRSSETNKLLCLSFERVLEYLSQSVNSLDWDGDDENSLIAHAIKTIRQLIDLASVGSDGLTYCLYASLKFVTSLVDQLKDGKDMNQASIWERDCTLILELCKTRYLSDKMISYIIETILKISEDLKNGLENDKSTCNGCGCGPSFEPHSLENSWYMFYVLKKLMIFKKETAQQSVSPIPTSMSEVQHGEVCNIKDLWRLNWKGNDPHEGTGTPLRKFYAEQDSFESGIVVKWKDQLNHYIKLLSFHYPLFSYELYQSEKLL
ncbi:uncharacterized protein [Hetaerina americana]|uniref:uncharacterized protein n=1 Tax=Hetaerina americana TaxID=62018 RepID=UPI003A7F3A08